MSNFDGSNVKFEEFHVQCVQYIDTHNRGVFLCCTIYIFRCCNTFDKTSALSCDKFSGPSDANFGEYCPAPPTLNINDIISNTSSQGPLDSDNTFIAEYLITVADKLQPAVFFQELAAGFVVSYNEPSLSFCGQSSSIETRKISAILNIIYNISAFNIPDEQCRDDLTRCADGSVSSCEGALDLPNCVDDLLSQVTILPGEYYDSLPYDMQSSLNDIACRRGSANNVSKYYPAQDSTTTVTIWYNNQVSINYILVHFYGAGTIQEGVHYFI